MKSAQIEDAWRHVREWACECGLADYELKGIPGFQDAHMTSSSGMVVLCGVNSAGKTRLLGQLEKEVRAVIDSGSCTTASNLEFQATPPTDLAFIDVAWLVQKERLSIVGDANLTDRVEQAALTKFRQDAHNLTCYLVGKDYTNILFAELEATELPPAAEGILGSPDPGASRTLGVAAFRPDVVPYFKVSRDNHTFDSRDLSLGELAGLTLIWALQQLERNTLALIDEPEAFLSPNSSSRILDVIAYYADDRSSQCWVASHSHLGILSVPEAGLVYLLMPDAYGNSLPQLSTPERLWASLKLAPPRKIILFTEDRAASEMLWALLKAIDYEHGEATVIWRGPGDANVIAATRFPDSPDADVAVFGVLDGDMRTRARRVGANSVFLPGDESPETLVCRILPSWGDSKGTREAGRVQAALFATQGMDAHDRVKDIATRLGMSVSALRWDLFNWWFTEPEGAAAVVEFAAQMTKVAPRFPATS